MRLPQRYFGRLLSVLRGDYIATWRHIVRANRFVVSRPWMRFQRSIAYTLQWGGLLSAASVRYQGIHQSPVITGPVKRTIESLTDEADAMGAGGTVGERWRDRNEEVLARIAADNPWVSTQLVETNPFVAERAAQVGEIERDFLEKRARSLAQQPMSTPIYRLEMLKRGALAEVQQVAKQVQLADPEVGSQFPYAFYDTRDDARVRPTHKAMQNFVALRTWEGWTKIRPPVGWGCRCSVIFYTGRQAIQRGWMDKDGRPKFEVKWPNSASRLNFESGAFPDPGWHGPKVWVP